MVNQLKNSFFQVFTLTSLWITLLLTVFFKDQPIDMLYLWRIAGIAIISAGIFGVMYNVLWNYFTLRPLWNILISSTFSIFGGMGMVWLFSKEMFNFISPLLLNVVVIGYTAHYSFLFLRQN